MSAQSLRPVFQYISQRLKKYWPVKKTASTALNGLSSACNATPSMPSKPTTIWATSGQILNVAALVLPPFWAACAWLVLFHAATAEMSLAEAFIKATTTNITIPIIFSFWSLSIGLSLAAHRIEIKNARTQALKSKKESA
jgi:hypothetical protein